VNIKLLETSPWGLIVGHSHMVNYIYIVLMVICSILEGSYLLKALADHCNSIIHIHCMLCNIINNKIPISSFFRWTRCRDIQPRNHSLVASFLLMCSCIIIVNRGGLVGDMSRSIYHTVFMVKCGKICCLKHTLLLMWSMLMTISASGHPAGTHQYTSSGFACSWTS